MKLQVHSRWLARLLPVMLSLVAAIATVWLWLSMTPKLDRATNTLTKHRQELQQRQKAATYAIYQPLLARLQQPLPAAAGVILAVREQTEALGLKQVSYNLTQPVAVELTGLTLQSRKLSLGLTGISLGSSLELWQMLREALPCEVRLTSLSYESGRTAASHMELDLIGIN